MVCRYASASDGPMLIVHSDAPAPESVLVGFDRVSEELLMIQPLEELEDDLELRMRLLSKSVHM